MVTANSRLLAGLELAFGALVVLVANLTELVPLGETPWLVLVGWISLRLRGGSWAKLGLTRPASWRRTVCAALAAGVGLFVVGSFVVEPAVTWATGARLDLSKFRELVGNLPMTLVWVGLVWVFAAFGEELVYRGYLLDRFAALGNRSPAAYRLGVVGISVLFGVAHYYQGPAGMISSAFSGLVLGGLYLACGRNLWLSILAHGVLDTISLTAVCLGLVPGL